MAVLTVRNVPDEVRRTLRRRAGAAASSIDGTRAVWSSGEGDLGRVMMSERRRAGLVAVAGLVAAMWLTGCAPSACPAIGWSNTLTVQLDGDASAVDQVQLCTDDGCAPAEEFDPSGPLGQVTVEGSDGDSWTFSLGMTRPEQLTVRALAADGTVLSDTQVSPEWVRVGGSEQCGGPGKATVAVQP
jgi:plasmid stability protein